MENAVGEIYILTENIFNWDIPSYTLLLQTKSNRIWSPSFSYSLKNGNHTFVRAGWKVKPDKGYLALIFSSKDGNETPVKSVRFGTEDMTTMEIKYCDCEWVEKKDWLRSGYFKIPNLISIEDLHRNKRYPNVKPCFRLCCEILSLQRNTSTQTDKLCEINGSLTPVNVHQTQARGIIAVKRDKVRDVAINTIANEGTEDNKKTKSENCKDIKCPERLIQNLKDLYIRGKHTDVVIKVKDREFNVHKAILTARSPVFDGMFSHDLSEANSGIVPIEDCDPAVFEEFLFFLYTGRPQHLSSENACDLYYVADKYDIPEMKEKIVSFLKKSLSIETICDVICLSTKCNESELLDLAIHFFARNMEDIIVTVKWLIFLKENPIEANELTIKALKLGFTKRNT